MTEKQEFAHILRGVAAVSVMIAHYCGTFFIYHDSIAGLLQVPPLASLPERSAAALFINDWSSEFGQFGVGVFFIISGFVIPFSLASTGRLEFMKRRALRIYPIYIIGFSLVMCSIWLLTRYAGTDFAYSFGHMFSHLWIILRGFTNYGRIDGISWTLEVEIWFYVVMAIVGVRAIFRGPFVLCTGATVVAAAAILSTELRLHGFSTVGYSAQSLWASLLLVSGLSYHALFQQKLGFAGFIGVQTTVAVMLIVVWYKSFGDDYSGWLLGYLVAMAVFASAYALRNYINRNPFFDHFANISFPLYVVHALTGYGVMYWVITRGGGTTLAIVSAIVVAYLLAVALHFWIEKPCQRYSKAARFKSLNARIRNAA